MKKECIGFVLIREYPRCKKKVGHFEPFTTGEFFKYPEIWRPVYRKDEKSAIERDLFNELLEMGMSPALCQNVLEWTETLPIHIIGLSNTSVTIKGGIVIARPTLKMQGYEERKM